MWTEAEIVALKEALARPRPKHPARWGVQIPQDGEWTMAMVGKALGVSRDRVRLLLKKGLLPAPRRNERGHRYWSEEEVVGIVEAGVW